jgi:hypothetical protein
MYPDAIRTVYQNVRFGVFTVVRNDDDVLQLGFGAM